MEWKEGNDMNFENFVTPGYIASFAGMIIIVAILTQFTKSMLDKIIENRTKYLVYFWSVVLCVFAAYLAKDYSLPGIFSWFVNSIIVWLAAMKSFEVVKGE
jgi:hypothetical protein